MTKSLKGKKIVIQDNRVAMFPKGDPDFPLTEE